MEYTKAMHLEDLNFVIYFWELSERLGQGRAALTGCPGPPVFNFFFLKRRFGQFGQAGQGPGSARRLPAIPAGPERPNRGPRLTTAKCRRRPELPPASIPAVVAASRDKNRRPQPRRRRCPEPGRPSANGPRPISLSFAGPARKLGPFRPNAQSSPASLPGGVSFGREIRSDSIQPDPTRLSDDFFIYREAPQLFELGKFST
ncbi:hypothetical protein CRG98_028213 [Punica granatum]|uniref:Uncharacterized protein n=1 Tax=Punica granatum TaxID=22663 RepID=A0A2I0J5C2_PUNGR|nr:hypothetical protein CRG98_028213 [Punica granatum]